MSLNQAKLNCVLVFRISQQAATFPDLNNYIGSAVVSASFNTEPTSYGLKFISNGQDTCVDKGLEPTT